MAFASFTSSPTSRYNHNKQKVSPKYNKYNGLHLYKGKWRVQVTLDKGFTDVEDAQRYRQSVISHIKKRPETHNNVEDTIEQVQLQEVGDSIDQMVSPIKAQRQYRKRRISTANTTLSTRRRMRRSKSSNATHAVTSNVRGTTMNEFGDFDNSHLSSSNLQDWNTGALISKLRLRRSLPLIQLLLPKM